MKSENVRMRYRSFLSGYLLARSLPVSAIDSGWILSASFGAFPGEIIAIVIFLLCGMLISSAASIMEEKYDISIRLLTAAAFFITSELFSQENTAGGFLLYSADCLLVFVALFCKKNPAYAVLAFTVCAALIPVLLGIEFLAENMQKLIPAANALLCATAVYDFSREKNRSINWVFVGMALAMLFLSVN